MPAIRSMWMNFLSIPIRFHDLVLLCISSSVAFSFPSTTAAAVVIFIVVVVVVVVAVVIAAARLLLLMGDVADTSCVSISK